MSIATNASRLLRYGLICTLLGSLPVRADLTLSVSESAQAASPKPLLDRRLGRVTLSIQAPCLTCGNSTFFPRAGAVEARFSSDFLNELKTQLRQNGVLSKDAAQRLALHVNVLKISHDNTAGEQAQRENPLTHGGTQVTTITMEYVLSDGDQEIFRQSLSSKGQSNSLGVTDGPLEALDASLKKNLRVFLLSLKGALDPAFAPQAQQLASQISEDDPGTRSFLGYLVVGLGHVGVGAATVAEGTLEVLGSDAMAGAMSAAATQMRDNQRQFDRIQHQALMASANTRQASRNSSHTPISSATTPTSAPSTARPQQAPNVVSPNQMGTPSQTVSSPQVQVGQAQARQPQSALGATPRSHTAPTSGLTARDASLAATNNTLPATHASTSPAPSVKTEPADDRPRVGGPPNKKGCWIPDRNKPMCMVVVSEENRKGTMRVVYRNDCQWGIYASYENERTNGSWDSGADNIRPGQQKAWSTSEATGQYRFNFTGSDRSRFDWVCAGEDPGFKEWRR